MKRAVLAFAFVAVLLAPGAALAQAVVSGTVTDNRGRPLPGVTVAARPVAPNETERRTVTDASGRYRLENLLATSTYVLRFDLPGFTPVMRPNVDLSSGTATIDVTLTIQALAQPLLIPPPLDLPGPPLMPARQGRPCLHDTNESAIEAERRIEALATMRLIAHLVARPEGSRRQPGPFPSWAALPSSPRLEALRTASGAAADLARKVQWGTREPLPGWSITYVATLTDVAFTMTDERDPCRFTYSSADPLVVRAPYARVMPLT